jgi:steroid 5-alpha reductase family enzyme
MSLISLFSSSLIFYWLFFSITAKLFHSNTKNSYLYIFSGVGLIFLNLFYLIAQNITITQPTSIRQWLITILIIITGYNISLMALNKKNEMDFNIKKISTAKDYTRILLTLGSFHFLATAPMLSIHHLPGSYMLNWLDFIGLALWMLGSYYQIIATSQKKIFTETPENSLNTFKDGFWKNCRHPDFLGIIIQLWAFYLIAIGNSSGIFSFFGPLIITFILLKIIIPKIDKVLSKKLHDYKKYFSNTKMIFPNIY